MSNKPLVVNKEESEMGVTASKEDISYQQLFAETKMVMEDSEEETILSEIENQREEFATYEQLLEEEREDSSSIDNEDNQDQDKSMISYAQLLADDAGYATLTTSENKLEKESEKGEEELETGIESTKASSPEEEKGKDEGDTQETDNSVESESNGNEAKTEIKSASSLGMNQRVVELPLEDSITYGQIVEEGKVKRSPSIEAMLKRQKSKETSSYEDLAEEAQGIASENGVLDIQSDDSISYEEFVEEFLGPNSRKRYEITNERKAVVSEAINDKADPVVDLVDVEIVSFHSLTFKLLIFIMFINY